MPGLSDLSLKLLGLLADPSLRSSVLALFALLAIVIARTRSASARHAIWTTVLAGMLALPLLGLLLPPLPVKIVAPVWRTAAVIQSIQLPASVGTSGATTTPGEAGHPWSPRSPQPPAVPVWPVVLSVVYLAVALGLAVRLLVGYLLAQHLVRRSVIIREARAIEAFEDVAGSQGALYPLPALRTSDAVMVPLTIGWGRPAILLPSGWSSWDDWKLRAVLAHELAHIQRSDWLIAIAASINRSVFWFHPLAWWLERRLASLAEQAGDDAALSSLGDAPRYAGTILEFASALQATGGRLAQHGVAMARSCKVGPRIERLLALREPGAALVKKSLWFAILACALPLIYSAAALQLNRPAPQQTEPALDERQLLAVGNKMSAAEAQQIEKGLIRDPEDLNARASLIAYYLMQAMPLPYMQHVLWLIEHHPESEQAIFGRNPPSEDPRADFEIVKSAWLRQAAAHPRDARVLANIATLFEPEPSTAAQWFKRARELDPSNPRWTERLSEIYARTIYHSTPRPPGFESSDPAFASVVKSELESSGDAKLLGTVGVDLARQRAWPGPDEWQRIADRMRREYAEMLLKRAASLEPDNRGWAEALEMLRATPEGAPQGPQAFSFAGQTFSFAGPVAGNQITVEGPARLGVAPQVQAENLITQVPPEYPALARQARLQGVVRFKVTIGRDGRLAQMELISGHPLLVPAAREALAQWVYRPTLLNGIAAEVVTEVEVPFRLSE